jgi:hypothetical protein
MSLNEDWWAVPNLPQIEASGDLRGLMSAYFSDICSKEFDIN